MNDSKHNRIIICSPKKSNIDKILKNVGDNQFKWAYFGENIPNTIYIDEKFIGKGKRLNIGNELQKIANAFRQPYIEYIGNLSVKNNSILWWVSSLSEKNPYISKTFLYSCYIRVAQSLIENNSNTIVFFVENRALRLSFVSNIRSTLNHEIIHIEPKLPTFFDSFIDTLEFIIKHVWFLLNNVYRIILVKHIYKLNKMIHFKDKNENKDDLVLLHTWVDKRSFSKDNTFHDAYFGALKDYIKEKNKNVVIIPSFLHTVSYSKSVKKILNCEENFLIPAAFLKLSDILKILTMVVRKPDKKSYPYFENLDISYLAYNDYFNDWKNTRVASNLLFYCLIKNLKDSSLSIERLIYTYENHTWEKVFCMAFRDFFPLATIIGYQHGGFSMMLMNYFFSENERHMIPFPHKVITNGRYFENIFLRSGYDPTKTQCGGAIRYEYLTIPSKQTTQQNKIKRDAINILVAPSIGKNDATELVYKVVRAFESLDMCNIILKFHPVMPYQQIANEINITSLPEHFKVSLQPISELLMECDLLLYTESTTCLEAIATGVHPINVSSDIVIDCDFLDLVPEVRSKVRTENEIRSKVQELLEMNPDEFYKTKINAKKIANEFLGEVDNSIFDMFLS